MTASAPATGPRSGIMRDAVVTIGARLVLAGLILATDVAIARLLGPAAKGRFTLVLLYSQLAALAIGFGLDNALGYVAGRSRRDAARGLSNAAVWSFVVGGLAVIASLAAYGVPSVGAPAGPLVPLLPNLSGQQFLFAALALPGEMLFGIGLFALVGRRRVVHYNAIRILRRLVLLLAVVATAAIARLSLDVALIINLVALGAAVAGIAWSAARDSILGGAPSAKLLAEQLRFGARSVVGSLAERLQFRADAFLVNILLGVAATGVYSVTSGLAETLWYVPNALGVVMFSRAVDPRADAARVACAMTRSTIALSIAMSVPVFILAPWLVQTVYGPAFAAAADALRAILPGVVAYSVVAILSRYVVGRGAPGTGTLVLLAGLATNIAANVMLIPRFGIVGAAVASSLSYGLTAILTVVAFRRLSGRGLRETLLVRRSDLAALVASLGALGERLTGRRRGPLVPMRGGEAAAELVIGEHDPGEER